MHSYRAGQHPDGAGDYAIWDFTLIKRGLWHMHGGRQYWTSPQPRQSACMAEADKASRQAGFAGMLCRIHNRMEE
jgi:hypothetical protein